MPVNQNLTFYINLPDKDLVEQLQTTPGQGGYVGATSEAPYNPGPPPGGAAVAYGQMLAGLHPDTYPVPPYMPLKKDSDSMVSPSLSSAWFGSPYNFPTNVREFTRKTGGWFGISWLFGTTVKFYWRGWFVYVPDKAPIDPVTGEPSTEPVPIPKRRWVDGFEVPSAGEGGGGSGTEDVSRGSSRTPEGYGLAIRGWAGQYKSHTLLEYHGSTVKRSWERFYVRLVAADPGASVNIWMCASSPSAGEGIWVDITATGQFAVWSQNASSVQTLLATTGQLEVGVWTKVDLLLDYDASSFRLFVNGVLKGSFTVGVLNGTHQSSRLGNSRSVANNLEIDVDDWTNADIPYYQPIGDPPPAPVERLESIDWVNGSHVTLVRPTAFGVGHGTWAGDWRRLLNNPVVGAEVMLTSSTSGARLEVQTDADLAALALEGSVGPVAMVVSRHGSRAGTLNGQLGWSIDGAESLAAIVENSIADVRSRFWQPAGDLIQPLGPIAWNNVKLIYVKAASVDLATIWNLLAAVEVVGVFGEEDLVKDQNPALEGKRFVRGPHNAPYPSSPWVRSATPPLAPLMIVSGTYTGNDIGQDLIAKLQLNWWWVRPLTGDSGGVKWWPSMLGPHRSYERAIRPQGMAQALIDPAFAGAGAEDEQEQQTLLRVAGNHTQSNAAAVVYQYVGFADPAMRNLICGAFTHKPGAPASDNPLVDLTFLPEAVWLMVEQLGLTTTASLWYKGPGHAADGAQNVSTAETAAALTIATGKLTSDTPLHISSVPSVAYAAFRRHDGSDDPNADKILRIASYVGNGSGSRTIGLTPASGRRPLWGFVGATNAAGFIRDPSHTGVNSSPIAGGTQSTTAIIGGGVDEFTVGATLNANGVTYNYFIMIGCTAAGNGGWSVQCEYWPVDPGTLPPGPGPWPGPIPPPPTFPPPPPTEPPPTIPPDLPPEISGDCLPYTQEVGNLALSQIGHGREVADLETETTEEAYAIRRFYMQDGKTTLRDFPWPFATKYSTLTLVSGSPTTPVNRDWTYAYRTPADCLFERRIVVDRAGAVDPTPPPFALSSDAVFDPVTFLHTGGKLILTNEANAQLEYTAWPTCPARFGDPLFKEACVWRLAASLAPSLSRIPDRAAYCEARYQETIRKAWQVLRPGNPGPRPAAGTLDLAAAAAAANVAVVNRALVRIGARSIANLTTEQSREAVAAALVFENELRATLRDHPWAFATRYQDPLTFVAGTVDVPVNADWTFSYRLAAECVFARRLVKPGTGRRFDPLPDQFRTGTDATGGVLFCDIEEPVLEYTARVDGAVLQSDVLFQDAFAWRLAACLAPSLATVEPETVEQRGRGPEPTADQHPQPATKQATRGTRERMTQYAWAKYWAVLLEAQVVNAREQQPSRGDDDADWILAR